MNNITLKRRITITPLNAGHPMYSDSTPIYEVVVNEENDYALLYISIYPWENVITLLEALDTVNWSSLNTLSTAWDDAVFSKRVSNGR